MDFVGAASSSASRVVAAQRARSTSPGEDAAVPLLGDIGRALPADEQLDLSISRLGGAPAWGWELCKESPLRAGYLRCGICQGKLSLVAQLDAGYAGKPFRLLHIFGCTTTACGSDSRSWRVLRSARASCETAAWRGVIDGPCTEIWPSFALNIYAEPAAAEAPLAAEEEAHAAELLERYRQTCSSSAENEFSSLNARDGAGFELTGDDDEDDEAEADWMLDFQERLSRSPAQVVRYDWGGEPLWMDAPPPGAERPPPCASCGARRVFEVQLLPTLFSAVHALLPENATGEVGWGVVAVYTCSQDCEAVEPREEYVVVQPAI
eukprot:TRINITY_DN8745_c0_g4_i1.p1 TRINITY_DN8745_c0_g4~~TRINITY_DN8745_c0_g4_i1.p1  ORF type:complete len:322 (+),score=56.82 TRINITY_DN8745_c0_g4_i1:106-1071(+)